MRAFIDLTTITGGAEQARLRTVLQAYPDLEPSNLVVVAPAGAVEVPGGATFVASDGDPAERWTTLKGALSSFLQKGDEGDFVTSYQGSVGEIAAEASSRGGKVRFVDFRELVGQKKVQTWPEAYLPMTKALALLRAALVQRDGAIRMTQIRPALTLQDPRFKKTPTAPNPLEPAGVISLLVNEARARRMVSVDGPASNLVVTLNTVPATEPQTPERFDRESDRYISLLRDAGLGPFQQVRWAIYEAIEKAAASETRLSVGSLIDSSVQRVRDEIEAAAAGGREYLVRTGQRLPWSRVRGFIGILMTRTPVLLGAEGPMQADWLHLDDEVQGVITNWRQALDAQLVVHLVQNGCSINQYTEVDLSGAIYNTRLELEKVHQLLGFMLQSKVCGYTEDFTLRILP